MAGEELKKTEDSLPVNGEDDETLEPPIDDRTERPEGLRPEELPPKRNRSAWFDI